MNAKTAFNYKVKVQKSVTLLLAGALCLAFSSCASSNKNKDNIIDEPLSDIGLVKKGVPPALAQITSPYAYTEGYDCAFIAYQISQLDAVLGPDEMKSSNFDDRSMAQKSGEFASAAASDAVKSAAKGIIPARSIVRKLTGAEKADNELNKATNLGKIRRGFLHGLAIGKKCQL